MAKATEFFREVKQETAKVTWPTRQETIQTTIVVFIMVGLVALFLFFTDWIIANLVQFLLGV